MLVLLELLVKWGVVTTQGLLSNSDFHAKKALRVKKCRGWSTKVTQLRSLVTTLYFIYHMSDVIMNAAVEEKAVAEFKVNEVK